MTYRALSVFVSLFAQQLNFQSTCCVGILGGDRSCLTSKHEQSMITPGNLEIVPEPRWSLGDSIHRPSEVRPGKQLKLCLSGRLEAEGSIRLLARTSALHLRMWLKPSLGGVVLDLLLLLLGGAFDFCKVLSLERIV